MCIAAQVILALGAAFGIVVAAFGITIVIPFVVAAVKKGSDTDSVCDAIMNL